MRVLDSEKYNQTQSLADGARDFCDKVSQLNDIVKSVVEAVDQQVRTKRPRGRKSKEHSILVIASGQSGTPSHD